MKILITGGSGLLGQYLNIELSKDHDILTLYNENAGNCRNFNSVKCDMSNTEELKSIFHEFKPDVTIHTAAISRPELCDELPREVVYNVNVNSATILAELSQSINSKIIFTSTDLVYDGEQGSMLKENNTINPISLYAESKVAAEQAVRGITANHIILRTSLLFGLGLNHSTNNFQNTFLNFKNNKSSKLFFDQFRTPLSLKDASRLIAELAVSDLRNTTLNFGGRERVSRVELGEMLCKIGNFDNTLIERISMEEVPSLHKVRDVSMNTDLLQSLGYRQSSIEDAIADAIYGK